MAQWTSPGKPTARVEGQNRSPLTRVRCLLNLSYQKAIQKVGLLLFTLPYHLNTVSIIVYSISEVQLCNHYAFLIMLIMNFFPPDFFNPAGLYN